MLIIVFNSHARAGEIENMVLGGWGTVGECADVGRAIVDRWGEVGRGLFGKGEVSEAANRAEARLISLSTKLFLNIYNLAFYRLLKNNYFRLNKEHIVSLWSLIRTYYEDYQTILYYYFIFYWNT